MKSVLSRTATLHQAFWANDRGYRLAWLAGPQAASLAALALIFSPADDAGPKTAPWANSAAAAPASASPQTDVLVCNNVNLNATVRGQACDRLIQAGNVQGSILSAAYFGRAYMRQGQNQIDLAIGDYGEALKVSPGNVAMLVNRGILYTNKGNLSSALRDMNEAIGVNANNAIALANRAKVLRLLGRLNEASADVDKALVINPGLPFAQQERAAITTAMRSASSSGQSATPVPPVQTSTAPSAPVSADFDLCRNDLLATARRLPACDRVIAESRLPPAQLALAYYARALQRHAAGEIAKAIPDYNDSLKLNPTYYSAVQDRGTAYFGLEQYQTALNDFDTALKLKPDAALSYASKGGALEKLGKPKDAIEAATKAIALNSKLAYAYQVRADAYSDLKLWPQVITEATEALGLAPGSQRATMLRADAYLAQANYPLAIADYSELIRQGVRLAQIYNSRGLAFLRQGASSYDAALADFTEVLSIDPTAGYAYFNRSLVASLRDQDGQAMAELNKAIGISDKVADYFDRRGALYLKAKNYSDAEMDYSKAIELQPDNATLWNQRGRVQLEKLLERKAACAEETNNARGKHPDSSSVIGGSACSLPLDFDGPLKDFTTSIAKDPAYGPPHYNIGRLQKAADMPQQALQSFAAAYALNPGGGEALVEMGLIWFDVLNNEREALQKFNEAIALNPRSSWALSNRANVFAGHRGSRNEAIRDFRSALAIDPSDEYSKRGLKKLGVTP